MFSIFSDYDSNAHCTKHVQEHFHITNNLNKKKRLLTFWCLFVKMDLEIQFKVWP